MTSRGPDRQLARFLGAFSAALGSAQLIAPDRVNALIGVRDNPRTRVIQRAVGVQELSAAGGIFGMSPPTPFLLARVAGDGLHLTMLGRALGGRRNDRERLVRAIGAVSAVALLDVIAAARHLRAAPTDPYGRQTEGKKAPATELDPAETTVPGNPSITIRASREEIERRIDGFEIASHGQVSYSVAPGERGTEVHVAVREKEHDVRDELRRLKQAVEVGEITVSDAAPEGVNHARQLKQRPAQPMTEKDMRKVGAR